ncbi:chromate resistance protein ChrB domain-containing protein [Neorhizobium alkalisoli]|uniref:chromate resistance protein ChrB domain-containing protein n=1 Tax=Neorhizobium alkalisoli TaxID=528178 RepID=UPI000CF95677|nr:sulfurtransferase/chromate resistance protein [Neorhizobium alkalisoli]
MATYNAISPEKLARLIGTPKAPVIIDVRDRDDFAESPFLLPASLKKAHDDVADWAPSFKGRWVVVVCQKGRKLSEGVAAFLRIAGAEAEVLEGGFESWRELGLPLLPLEKIPERKTNGATLWVTRARPKIDRIACPWLIRRFVDPDAAFLFVSAAEVEAVAERFGATPFDVEGVFWSHRGELCSFDIMVEEFGLVFPALAHLARIVRGADTDRPDLEPQAAGLLAISLGLSRMYSDDLEQLEQGMLIYDALYRWARDATDEKHDWVVHGPRK